MLKLLLLFLLHVSQPKHFLVETESKAKTPGGSLTELGGQDASSSIAGRSGGFSGGTRLRVRSNVSFPVHLGYQMTITCAASHALGRCIFRSPSQRRTRRRTFEYRFKDSPIIEREVDRISISERAYTDPKICEIVVDNIQSYDIGEWRCKVSCTVEELGAGQCQGRVKTGRGRGDIEKNILVTETAGLYHLRAPATVSQYPWGIVDSVELGYPITISCNANKELATCMFEPPNSPWNNTYVRSGDAVYIKENSRISTSETAARGPCEIVVDNVEKKDLGDWRCRVRTNSEEIMHMINVAEYKEEE